MPEISIEKASKSYGSKRVLRNVSFKAAQGETWGILGRNGAGKTTLMKSVVGLVRLNSGKISIDGEDSWDLSPALKARLGYAPQLPELIASMNPMQMLAYAGSFYPVWDEALAGRLMREWKLDPAAKISTLSPGNAEKLSVVMALCNKPDVIVLDEPAAAMDPEARRAFLDCVASLAGDGSRCILFSTHIVGDVERIASHIAVIDAGEILFAGRREEMPGKPGDCIEDRFLALITPSGARV